MLSMIIHGSNHFWVVWYIFLMGLCCLEFVFLDVQILIQDFCAVQIAIYCCLAAILPSLIAIFVFILIKCRWFESFPYAFSCLEQGLIIFLEGSTSDITEHARVFLDETSTHTSDWGPAAAKATGVIGPNLWRLPISCEMERPYSFVRGACFRSSGQNCQWPWDCHISHVCRWYFCRSMLVSLIRLNRH